MSREKLNAAARHFFERILPAATKKRLSELANAEVLVGAYRRHAGGPVQSFGNPITAQFMLKIAPGAVPIQNGLPTLGEAQVGEGALDQPLVWMRFAADPKLDDKAAIQDLMGDLDTYAQRKFSLAGVNVELTDETPAPPNSASGRKQFKPIGPLSRTISPLSPRFPHPSKASPPVLMPFA